MDEVTFARNSSMLNRSETDVLIMCTDAGFSTSMMVFYLGKEFEGGTRNLFLQYISSKKDG